MNALKCHNCNSEVNDAARFCPSCEADVGFPNVRLADSPGFKNALENRYIEVSVSAAQEDLSAVLVKVEELVQEESHVVVAVTSLVARSLLVSTQSLFTNYESQVSAGQRQPASSVNDKKRFAVSGAFFGAYADKICYGCLSINGIGLSNYGSVHMRLKDISIKDRVTFIEDNTYKLHDSGSTPGTSPVSVQMATWASRSKLACIKLFPSIVAFRNAREAINRLVSQGKSGREDDQFIEAHVYGSFNKDSIEKLSFTLLNGLSKPEQLDIKIIREMAPSLI